MTQSLMYHEGNRRLQDQFDSRRISDRLEQKLTRQEFTADDKAFIESLPYFFLASADAAGRPDCSFKGGEPGFVRVTGPSEIAFPDYDGNRRLRVNGEARVSRSDHLLSETIGAQLIVRVAVRAIFPNCPRYIPSMQLIEPSTYVPRAGGDVQEPAWKGFADFKDYVHPRQDTFRG
jgi:hypothetical protein